MFIHFSLILIIFKENKKRFNQENYDSLFFNIENNLREMGFGDVSVNKKMKEINKIFYDILLKLITAQTKPIKINEKLIIKYFPDLKRKKTQEYMDFESYLLKFYEFCSEKSTNNMIREAINFKF
jgi:cytochrome b pre-mRNA-processing protein 3